MTYPTFAERVELIERLEQAVKYLKRQQADTVAVDPEAWTRLLQDAIAALRFSRRP